MVKYLADNDLKKELDKRKLTFIRKLAVLINENVRITNIGNRSRDDLTKEILKRVRYDFDNDLYRFRGKANQFSGGIRLALNMKKAQKDLTENAERIQKIEDKKSPAQLKKEKEQTINKIKAIGEEFKNAKKKTFKSGFPNKLPSGKTTESFQYFKTAWNKQAKKDGEKRYNFIEVKPKAEKSTRTISTQT